MTKTLSYKTSLIFLIVGSILFGTSYIGSAILLYRGLTPLELIAGRFFVSTVVMNIVLFKKLKTLVKGEVIGGIFLGTSMFFTFLFQVVGLQHTTPAVSAFITSTYVVIVPFMHWAYYKKSPDIYAGASALLTVIGVGLISLGDGSENIGFDLGVALTLIGAIFAALQIFASEIYNQKYDPLKLTMVMLTTCFSLSFISAIIKIALLYQPHEYYNPSLLLGNALILILISVFATLLPYTLHNIGQKYVDATKASLIMSTEAIFATIFSILIFGEVLSLQMIIGCFLIISAIVISQTKLKFK